MKFITGMEGSMVISVKRAESRKFSSNNPHFQKNGESSSGRKNSVSSLSKPLRDNIRSIDFKQPTCSRSSGAIYELKRTGVIHDFTQ
jgi:hypothetical protein